MNIDKCENCGHDHLEPEPVENCSCHISPPCHRCVDAPMVCQACDHEHYIEE